LNLSHRLNIWKTNIDFINKHNSKFVQGLLSFEVGMNQFGDLTKEEFQQKFQPFIKQTFEDFCKLIEDKEEDG
jgi:RNA-binding protein YlmH